MDELRNPEIVLHDATLAYEQIEELRAVIVELGYRVAAIEARLSLPNHPDHDDQQRRPVGS